MRTLTIDIVSDVACPWCVIGYKHLEEALARLDGELDVDLSWHAFELRPDSALEGENWREHIMRKYGMTREQSEASRQRISEAGQAVGFTFNFTDDMKVQNTFNCHRLLAWAKESGHQTDLKLRLFQAYFTDRSDVNDPAVLIKAVEDAGLDGEEARRVLDGEDYSARVREEEQHWQRLGVQSVPTFVVNGKYAITGGQPTEVFEQALRDIAREMNTAEA